MKVKGEELEFLLLLNGDGHSEEVGDSIDNDFRLKSTYQLKMLSLSKGTYIASGIGGNYIVKMKNMTSKYTNSMIGTDHWFKTLVDFIKTNIKYESNNNIRWAKVLDMVGELERGKKYINKDTKW